MDPWPLRALEAYLSRDSVAPLESLTIHVRSEVGPYRVDVLRRGLADSPVASLGTFSLLAPDIPDDAVENGCGWPATTSLVIPVQWSSGLYIVRISTAGGTETCEVPFVVKPGSGQRRTRILVCIASATYEAYNWWGGKSLYGCGVANGGFDWGGTAAFRVSMHRPYLSATDFEKPKFQYWELPFIRWLERNGIEADFCTSRDLHANANLLNQYELLVCVGHDEYWSWEMRDNVEDFVAMGNSAAILSGNSVWWQIRFDEPDAITCYKEAADDPANANPATRSRVTVNWTSPPVNRSEALLTGVSFKYSANLIYGDGVSEPPAFEVIREHPLFAHTNLTVGGRFGTYTDSVGARPPWRNGLFTVIGYECDARPLPNDALNWRATWDTIVPVDASGSNAAPILFYDKAAGEGELYRIAASSELSLVRLHAGWRRSWDQIVTGSFAAGGAPCLLFYDRIAGQGELYATDSQGQLSLLRSYQGWRNTWSWIVPGNFGGSGQTDLMFYDRDAGRLEFHATDGSAKLTLLNAYDPWQQGWTHIEAGSFSDNAGTDLLFYDRETGKGAFYSTTGSADLSLLKTHEDWRQTWDRIVALQFGGQTRSVLLFYDRDAGIGEFHATDGHGNIQLLASYVNWRTTWRHIVPLRLDGSGPYLLFYEDITGYAELYSVNMASELVLVRAYSTPAFTLLATAMYQPVSQPGGQRPPLIECASLGVLRIEAGQVFTAPTTDWSFGLSQSPSRWSPIDQITANVLHLFGSASQVVRTVNA